MSQQALPICPPLSYSPAFDRLANQLLVSEAKINALNKLMPKKAVEFFIMQTDLINGRKRKQSSAIRQTLAKGNRGKAPGM